MSRDFDRAQEMVVASMEYVKVLGFRLRRTEGQRDDWKQVAQSHAEELIQCRQQIDVLKSERNAERKAHDEYKERNRELFNQKQRLTAELVVIKDERDALRAQIDTEREPKPVGVPRAHPVTVGEYVKRLTGFNTTPAGEIGRVTQVDDDASEIEYEVTRPNGQRGVWCAKNCTPCEPPTAATHDTPEGKQIAESAVKREPKPGDKVRLVREPSHTDIPAMLPWSKAFGMPGDTAIVVIMAVPDKVPSGTIPVRTGMGRCFFWPISCIEIVEDAK